MTDTGGEWFLFCPVCKTEIGIINGPDDAWCEAWCPDCSRTVKHDITKGGMYVICRHCNKVKALEQGDDNND